MQKIIVPVDFSQDSITALDTAITFAKKIEAEILLVHVNKIKNFPSFFTSTRASENPEDIERSFDELIANTNNDSIPLNRLVLKGSVDGEIHKLVEKEAPYLIIMGTHGASGHRDSWAGSNAYKVVTHVSCPVITMRGDYKGHGISRIVLPIDISHSSRHKVPFTMELAKFFNAEIHVIAASMDDSTQTLVKTRQYAMQACNHIEEFDIKTTFDTVNGSNITDMTIEYARKVDADLISIMTDQESSVANMFMGPYAQQMINNSPIPVLSMHKNPKLDGAFSIM
jgi:nucleotide-binding universal stress UspA family protein